MVDFYSSWVPGLAGSGKALKLLRDCDELSGVECSYYQDHDAFQGAGLKVSFHDPFRQRNRMGLVEPGAAKVLSRKENIAILDRIRKSDSPVVGFHLSHNLARYIRLRISGRELDIKKPRVIGKRRLVEIAAKNLLELYALINKNQGSPKFIAFETGGYYNFSQMAGFDKLRDREELRELMEMVSFLNSYEFLEQLFSREDIGGNEQIGFLFDISHVLSSASTHMELRETQLVEADYARKAIAATRGRVFQLHINAPKSAEHRIVDAHLRLSKDTLSRLVLDLAREIERENPQLCAATLEIDEEDEPLAHAKLICSQAKLIRKELNF